MSRKDWDSIRRNLSRAVKENGDWVLEIGAYMGETTAFMAGLLQGYETQGHRVISVDPFSVHYKEPFNLVGNKQEYQNKLIERKVFYMVDCLSCTSEEAIKYLGEGFAFLLIDGSHTCENVKLDILNYTPRLKRGGIV